MWWSLGVPLCSLTNQSVGLYGEMATLKLENHLIGSKPSCSKHQSVGGFIYLSFS
jgi:hypothetical protein